MPSPLDGLEPPDSFLGGLEAPSRLGVMDDLESPDSLLSGLEPPDALVENPQRKRQRLNVASIRRQGQQQREDIAQRASEMGVLGRTIGSPLKETALSISSLASRPFSAETADELNRYAQDQAAARQLAAERESLWPGGQKAVGGAVRSLATAIPAGMVAGPYGAIGVAVAEQGNQAVTEGRDAGLRGWGLAGHVGAQATIEGVPAAIAQKIGLGGFESIAGNLGRGAAKEAVEQGARKALTNFAKETGAELTEELVTAFGQRYASQLSGVSEALDGPEAAQIAEDTALTTLASMGLVQGAQSVSQRLLDGPRPRVPVPQDQGSPVAPPEMAVPPEASPASPQEAQANAPAVEPLVQAPNPFLEDLAPPDEVLASAPQQAPTEEAVAPAPFTPPQQAQVAPRAQIDQQPVSDRQPIAPVREEAPVPPLVAPQQSDPFAAYDPIVAGNPAATTRLAAYRNDFALAENERERRAALDGAKRMVAALPPPRVEMTPEQQAARLAEPAVAPKPKRVAGRKAVDALLRDPAIQREMRRGDRIDGAVVDESDPNVQRVAASQIRGGAVQQPIAGTATPAKPPKNPVSIQQLFVGWDQDMGQQARTKAGNYSTYRPRNERAFHDAAQRIVNYREPDARQVSLNLHETAHDVHTQEGGWDVSQPALAGLLGPEWDYDPNATSRATIPLRAEEERFAGWFMQYVLHPDVTARVTPEYHAAFEAFAKQHPGLRRAIPNLRRGVSAYFAQTVDQLGVANVGLSSNPPTAYERSWWQKLDIATRNLLKGVNEKFYDENEAWLNPLDEIERKADPNIPEGDTLKSRWRAMGAAGPKAMDALENGITHPVAGARIAAPGGGPMNADWIYEGVPQDQRMMAGVYAAAKHALSELDRTKEARLPGGDLQAIPAPVDPGLDRETAERIVADMENRPGFKSAHKRLTEFNNTFLKLFADIGMTAQETADLLIRNRPDYLPMYRVNQAGVFNQLVRKVMGKGTGGKELGLPPIYRRKGSSATVVNPFISTIAKTMEAYSSMESFLFWKELGDRLDAGKLPGAGHIIERIEMPTEPTPYSVYEEIHRVAQQWRGPNDPAIPLPSPDTVANEYAAIREAGLAGPGPIPPSMERFLRAVERSKGGQKLPDPTVLREAVMLAQSDPQAALDALDSAHPERWLGGKSNPIIRVHEAPNKGGVFHQLMDLSNQYRKTGEPIFKHGDGPAAADKIVAGGQKAVATLKRALKAAERRRDRAVAASSDPASDPKVMEAERAVQASDKRLAEAEGVLTAAVPMLSDGAALSADFDNKPNNGVRAYRTSLAAYRAIVEARSAPHAILRAWSKLTNFQKLWITGANVGFSAVELFRNFQVYAFQRKHAPGVEDKLLAWWRGLPANERPPWSHVAQTYLDPFAFSYRYLYAKMAPQLARGFEQHNMPKVAAAIMEMRDPFTLKYIEEGGERETFLGRNEGSQRRAARRLTGDPSFTTSQDLAGRAADGASVAMAFLKTVLQATDAMVRIPEMKAAYRKHGITAEMIRNGYSVPASIDREATQSAGDVGVNFLRQGEWTKKYLSKAFPYFSAALASQSQMWQTYKRDPAAFALRGLLYGVVPTAALWLAYRDEEHRKEAAPWTDRFFILYDEDGNPRFRFAKAQGYQDFWSGGTVALLDWMAGIDKGEADRFATNLVKAFIPPGNPIKDASGVATIIALMTNEKTFPEGASIVPKSLENLPPEMQFNENTPSIYRWMGENLGVSPMKAQYFAESMTGGLASRLVNPKQLIWQSERFGFSGEFGQTLDVFDKAAAKADSEYQGARHAVRNKRIEDIAKATGGLGNWRDFADAVDIPNSALPRDVVDRYVYTRAIKDLMTGIRQATQHIPREERDRRLKESESYMIGLARAAAGQEPLDRYPNPLEVPSSELPERVRSVRDKWLGNYLYQITNPETIDSLTNEDRLLQSTQAASLVKLARKLPMEDLDAALLSRIVESGGTNWKPAMQRLERLRQKVGNQ